MGLNFEPESEDALRERYPEAIKKVFDVHKIEAGKCQSPGKSREHVFDFEEGLRLIVSRDTDGQEVCIHFSASMHTFNEMEMQEFMQFVVRRIVRIAGVIPGTCNAAVGEGGTLHLVWRNHEQTLCDLIGHPKANPMWN